MRELQEKDLSRIADRLKNYTVVLEAVDAEFNAFTMHIRARGRGGGTLVTARGAVREFKTLGAAMRFITRHLPVDEVLILLERPERDDPSRKVRDSRTDPP